MKSRMDLIPSGSIAVVDKFGERTFAGYFVDKKPWVFLTDNPFLSYRDGIIGNIYKGRVTKVVGNGGAFLDIGAGKDVFLSGEKVSVGDFVIAEIIAGGSDGKAYKACSKLTFSSTSVIFISSEKSQINYSQKLSEKAKDRLKVIEESVLYTLKEKLGGGRLIIRTAAENADVSVLSEEISAIIDEYLAVKDEFSRKLEVGLLRRGKSITQAFIDDYLSKVDCVITNDPETEEIARKIGINVIRVNEKIFTYKYALEILNEITSRKRTINDKNANVRFDYTETCTFIDVNSGNYSTRVASELAKRTNLSAIDEIVRQISLRDVAGAIVIDFITMKNVEYERIVIKTLRKKFESDCRKVKVYPSMTALGYVEIERERKYRKIEYDRNGDEFVKFNADYITMNLLSLLEDEPNFGEIDNPVVKIIFASSVYKTIKCELLEYIKENYSYKIVCEIDESGTIVKDNPFVISYGLE